MTMVPSSTGIGAPGTAPAPASLARSPMAASGAPAQAAQIPFVRGSSLATMLDISASPGSASAATTNTYVLQTNAFLECLVMDIQLTTVSNSASVTFLADAPWSVISQIYLNDPANQAIITPITGYGLYLMNKYLNDTECFFDPGLDPNYSLTTGSAGGGGSFSFRLVVPIEHRRRDALGAVNNSAANQRYLLGLNLVALNDTTVLYNQGPTTAASTVSLTVTQIYWTSPPASITTSAGSTGVQPTPTGLGTVCFVRYERHNEVSGGGSPQMQLQNVGDYISGIIFVLRNSSNARIGTSWPGGSGTGATGSSFQWWVNDFQVHNLNFNMYQRELARFYRLTAAVESAATSTAGGLDLGVFPLPFLAGLFDRIENFAPASQYLPTDATTKLQIRGSSWGTASSYLEVYTRTVRPVSGAALFS